MQTRSGIVRDSSQSGFVIFYVIPGGPADVAGLVSLIRRMMTGLSDGTITVDSNLVERWRQLFSLSRERREWQDAICEIS